MHLQHSDLLEISAALCNKAFVQRRQAHWGDFNNSTKNNSNKMKAGWDSDIYECISFEFWYVYSFLQINAIFFSILTVI